MKILMKATKKPQDSLAILERAPSGYGVCLEGTQLDFVFLTPSLMLSSHLRLNLVVYPEDGGRRFVRNISACRTQEDGSPQMLSLCGLLY
jgi:hypothetical protein